MDYTTKCFKTTISPYVNEVWSDPVGNIIAHKKGVGNRIMLIAHKDVVRLMVTYIDPKGYLYVKPAGGIDVSILPARKVVVMHEDKSYIGIIGKKPDHLIRDEQNNKVSYDSLWIDIGASSQEQALTMVGKGDYVYFCSEIEDLPNDLITGAYLDNLVGINVLLKLAEQLYKATIPWDIYYVASNHEEIGMRGAVVAAQSVNPDVCICIDVTHATDYPTMNLISYGDIKTGDGCVLAKGPDIHSELFMKLEKTAVDNLLSYQVEVSPYPTGTDANVVQLYGQGVRTAVVSVPCRYMHTPHEICSRKDIDSAVALIDNFLRNSDNLFENQHIINDA